MSASQNWFITGISRGFGAALAEALLERGDTVVGTTRDGTSDLAPGNGTLHVVALDVAVPEQAERAVRQAVELSGGRLDVVVNNAGYGLLGSFEDTGEQEVRDIFEVNVFGAMRIMRAALPQLRAQRSGHIVNITSIAELDPYPGSGVYAATKSALGAVSDAIAREVEPLGIRVTAVAPGTFRTDFLSAHSIRMVPLGSDDYAETVGGSLSGWDALAGKQPGDPAKAAAAIIEAVDSPEPPRHLVLGADALARARSHHAMLGENFTRWEQLTLGTAFQEA